MIALPSLFNDSIYFSSALSSSPFLWFFIASFKAGVEFIFKRLLMNFLILHQKAPAQFRCIVEFLIANNHSVTFASEYGSDWTPSDNSFISNYRHISVSIDEKPSSSISSIHRAGHFRKIFLKLRKDGFKPDIILSHSGWGAGLYSLDIFPESKLISYLEWYYSCASLLLSILLKVII